MAFQAALREARTARSSSSYSAHRRTSLLAAMYGYCVSGTEGHAATLVSAAAPTPMSNPKIVSPGPVPSNPNLRSVHEAMHMAAAKARRRASRTSAAIAASERTQALLADVDEESPACDDLLGPALREAERALISVAETLAHFTIPGLGGSKRTQLAAGCLHLVIEHGQSIVALTQDKCFGSALALQRPLYETFWRGLWLRYAATDEQVDDAERDKFPLRHDVIQGLKRAFEERGRPPHAKGDLWRLLSRHAYGGHPDIGARLTTDGLQANYTLREVAEALCLAGMTQLAAAIEVACMAANESLARTVLEHLQGYAPPTAPSAAATETDA